MGDRDEADRTDEAAEIGARVDLLTDAVHDLLNGPEGTGQFDGPQETMRVVLEVPKAWILLASWLERTAQVRRAGRYAGADVREYSPKEWRFLRQWARQRLHLIIQNSMHDELHELAIGAHPFLEPPPKPPEAGGADDLEDGIPF